MDFKEHRLIFRRFNSPQRQNCRNERRGNVSRNVNVARPIERRDVGQDTREALAKRLNESNAKVNALIAKFQTNPKLYLNTWKKFTPEYNKAKFALDAVQKQKSESCRTYCQMHCDPENQALKTLEDIVNKSIAEAAALTNPEEIESTTVRASQRFDVAAGTITENIIRIPNYTDITFDFDPVGGVSVLPSVIDGRERAGPQTFGNLEKDGYTVTRDKGTNIIKILSDRGFTVSFDQIKILGEGESVPELEAKAEIKKDMDVVREVLANKPETPKQNPAIYEPSVTEIENTVAESYEESDRKGAAAQVAVRDDQLGTGRMRHAETGEIHAVQLTVDDPNNQNDQYELQAANPKVEALVKKEEPHLLSESGRQMRETFDKLYAIAEKNPKNTPAVENAIRSLDALTTFSKENSYNPNISGRYLRNILNQKRDWLVWRLPSKQIKPSYRFEDYQLIVKNFNDHREQLTEKFKNMSTRTRAIGRELVEVIKAQIYAMRQYKINLETTDKNDQAKFPFTREYLVQQWEDVEKSMPSY